MEFDVPPKWLHVCADLLDNAQKMANCLPVIEDEQAMAHRQKLFCYSLLGRTITNFHGTALLVTHGLRIEALTLARSTIESSLFLSVLARNITFLKELDDNEDKSREGVLKEMIGLLQSTNIDPDFEVELTAEVQKLVETKAGKAFIKVSDLAEAIERKELYALYRHLSGVAAHPSRSSILMGYRRDADGGVTIGEIKEGGKELSMDTALFCACTALLAACHELNKLAGEFYPPELLAGFDERIVAARRNCE